ncbi:hypothetical protein RvY_06558 [Ramazzottius varieornatus]|uniref:Uncharacterized protein n=1 Tax=Ramazzottius varieornatus TaxID=947166 RepID=A0A1D1V1X1_RAMVA|nr:hypothetical protein RvY_06558 [Ramazzottius varieornatus]
MMSDIPKKQWTTPMIRDWNDILKIQKIHFLRTIPCCGLNEFPKKYVQVNQSYIALDEAIAAGFARTAVEVYALVLAEYVRQWSGK